MDQRNNPDADRIRELLDQAAPRNTDTSGRAESVTRRARRARTTRGVAGGIAVAAVVAAVVITPQFLNTSATTNQNSDPNNDVVADQTEQPDGDQQPDGDGVLANPCPDQDGLYDGETTSVIPPGATSIRLCPVSLSGVDVKPWDAPDDALVEVNRFYTLVAEQEPADPARCAAANPVPDPLYFQVVSPNGHVMTAFSGSICSDITVDGAAYPSADVLEAFFASLATQRSDLTPPQGATAACPPGPDDGSWTWRPEPDTRGPGNSLTDAVSGVVCYMVDPMGGREYADDEAVLTDDQLQALVGDIAAAQTRDPSTQLGCTDTGPTRILVVVNAWGDRTSWTDAVCTGEFKSSRGYWKPGDAAEDVLAEALGGRTDG